MQKLSILIVDDEADILELIEYNLKKEGYDVSTANNGNEALEHISHSIPDLIVLDIMMPKMTGLELCEHLKKKPAYSEIPVIFLTAKSDEATEITGLNTGADDYIVKPISISRLISRIKTVLRRTKSPHQIPGHNIEIGDLKIDRDQYIVIKQDKKLRFPRKEFEVLYYLAANAGKVISRSSLLNEI
ncbi:response regulator transcription factor, partial [Balneolaceae bacterium ANBcel3]|nr:response regulator transcription factor [Balneolaceae bacterium ANBcel3]